MEQNTIDLHALAGDIAANLGDGWTCEPPAEEFGDRVAYLRHPDGHGLHLSRNWRDKSRLVVSGTYPRTKDGRRVEKPYNATWPEITAAISRPAAQIAKEIERRYLPDYLKLWAQMSERARSSDEYEDGKELAKLRIMAAVPVDFPRASEHRPDLQDRASFRFKNGGDFYGHVDVSGPNSVTMEIRSTDLARALEVLRALLGPRDIAADIAGVDALIAEREREWSDMLQDAPDLADDERLQRGRERVIGELRERRAELESLAERVRGLEVTE